MLKSTTQKYVTTNMCESVLEVIPEAGIYYWGRETYRP